MSSKYSAIANYLNEQPGGICEMRFSEIEDVLGEPLPASARRWTAWWRGTPSNSPTHSHARFGWHAAGWVVGELDIKGERVTFQKGIALPASAMMMEEDRKLLERAIAVVNDRPHDVAFSYDRDSDTMMVHFFGTPRPAVSISIEDPDDALYIRLDRAADEVVGLQIEGFISRFISGHPDWADTLTIARLRGITREEAVAAAAKARQQMPQVAAVSNLLERLIA